MSENVPTPPGANQQVSQGRPFPVPECLVQESIDRAQVPGLSLGILHEGSEYVANFGVTSVENPVAVDTDTLFQIGSITKTFTATAVMRLVERGNLNLDRPIRTYLPDFHLADEDAGATVTLRHLLAHSGGWWDLIGDTGENDDALAQFVAGPWSQPRPPVRGDGCDDGPAR